MKQNNLGELAAAFRRIHRRSRREKIRLVLFALLIFCVCEALIVLLDRLGLGASMVFFCASMAFAVWTSRRHNVSVFNGKRVERDKDGER